MAKSSSSKRHVAGPVTKQLLHETKNSSIKKNKKPKFKNTSTDKMALINNPKVENQKIIPQKNSPKNTTAQNNQNLPKEKFKQSQGKENSLKRKQSSSKGKQHIPKEKQISNESSNKQDNKKVNLISKKKFKKVNDSDSDSDSTSDSCYDVNRIIQETQYTALNDETFEDGECDTDIPNIFGVSLADDSDIDDEDFENEYDEEEEEEDEDSEEEDEDSKEEDGDESDNDAKTDEHTPSCIKDMISKLNKNEECEDKEEDDSDLCDVEEVKNVHMRSCIRKMVSNLNKNKKSKHDDSNKDDDDDDDDNDDDDDSDDSDENDIDIDKENYFQSDNDDEEDEEEETETDLRALLGKSMTDNDDDKDFNAEDEDDTSDEDDTGDEDDSSDEDDISDEDDSISNEEDDDEDYNTAKMAQKKITKEKGTKTSNGKDITKKDEHIKKRPLSPEEQRDIDKKTIFIDNIPKETKATALKKVFGQFGPINNIRFRGIVPKDSKTPKKVAAIKKDIHPKLHTVVAYINYKFEESAKKALYMNGKKFEGNYINVKIVAKSEQQEHNIKNAVFIGNLKFGTYNKVFKNENIN